MTYIRISKPLGVSLYERLRDAFQKKEAPAEEPQNSPQRKGLLAVHRELCDEYRDTHNTDNSFLRFSLLLVDIKQGDSAGVFRPIIYQGTEVEAYQGSDRIGGYFVPEELVLGFRNVLRERIEETGIVALLGLGTLRTKGEADELMYTALPVGPHAYERLEPAIPEPQPPMAQERVERKPLELVIAAQAYAA